MFGQPGAIAEAWLEYLEGPAEEVRRNTARLAAKLPYNRPAGWLALRQAEVERAAAASPPLALTFPAAFSSLPPPELVRHAIVWSGTPFHLSPGTPLVEHAGPGASPPCVRWGAAAVRRHTSQIPEQLTTYGAPLKTTPQAVYGAAMI